MVVVVVVVACDYVEGKGVGLGGAGWGGVSSENWRLQFGDLRVFMESNRPPSLAEGL